MEQTEKFDIFQTVTNNIIAQLELGTIPWQQPWTVAGQPKNLVSGKPYRGFNVMLLSSLGYEHNLFLTFNQAKLLGGNVRKGEKSHLVVFWKRIEVENKETQKMEFKPFLRYYLVFNIAQCDNIPPEKIPDLQVNQNDPILACEEILYDMPKRPRIQDTDSEAYYAPTEDYINVPNMKHFKDAESYYAVLFHELIHSTGHKDRLNRKEVVENPKYGSEGYSIEELTAEIGACFLSSFAGIPVKHIENHAAYIAGWLDVLKNDKKFIVFAANQGQKAVDYILDVNKEEIDQPEEEHGAEANREPEYIEFEDELPF